MTTPASLFDLRAFNRAGTFLGYLPDFSDIEVMAVMSDVGLISLSYPSSGLNASVFTQHKSTVDCYYQGVYLSTGIIEDLQNDDIAEVSLYTITMRDTMSEMGGACLYSPNWPTAVPIFTHYTNATAGSVLRDAITKSQARGELTGWTVSFTNTTDSSGNTWGTFTEDIVAGTPLLKIIQDFTSKGYAEFKAVGRRLDAYILGGMGTDRSGTVALRSGTDMKDAPRHQSSRGLFNVALVLGDAGNIIEVTDSASIAQYGRIVQPINAGNIIDTSTLTTIGQNAIALSKNPRDQKARGLLFNDPNTPIPFSNYFLGDKITLQEPSGNFAYRTRQITLKLDNQGIIGGALVLNDKFDDIEVQFNRQLEGITGGVGGVGSPNPGGANPVVIDMTIPSAVTTITPSSAVYVLADGSSRVQMPLTWNQVSTNTDGTAITDRAGYQVRYRYGTTGDGLTNWVDQRVVDTEAAIYRDLKPGAAVVVSVRCFDRTDNYGAWYQVGYTLIADNVAPSTPSTPTVDGSAFLGTLRVTWDGKDNGGTSFATNNPDFQALEVHASTASGFTPSAATLIDYFSTPTGGVVDFSASTTTATYVKFVAVDTSENRSTASAQSTGTTARAAVSSDLQDAIISAAKVGFTMGGGNFVTDSSFESTTTSNWSPVTRSTTQKHSGTQSLPLTRTGGSVPIAQGAGANSYAVVPGDKVVLSMWMYLTAAVSAKINLFSGVTNGDLAPVVADGTKLNQWQRVFAPYTIPTSGSYIPRSYADSGADGTWYIDDVQVERGDVPTSYAPRPDELLPGIVGTNELAAGAVVASKTALAALDNTSGALVANSVAIANIQPNAVTATKVAAGAITAEKLTIGSAGPNVVANPGFEDSGAAVDNPFGNATGFNAARWASEVGGSGLAYFDSPSKGSGSRSAVLYAPSNTSYADIITDYFPIIRSQVYFASVAAVQTGGATGGFFFRINWYNNAKTFISSVDLASNTTLPADSTNISNTVSGQATSPASASYATIQLFNFNPSAGTYVLIDDVKFMAVTVSAQIADGAVVAAKIQAGAVTAEKLTIGSSTDNLLLNSGFEDVGTNGFAAAWRTDSGGSVTTAQHHSGGRSVQISASGNAGLVYNTDLPVSPGDILYMSAWLLKAAGTTQVYLRALFLDVNHTYQSQLTDILSAADINTVWTQYAAQVTVPAGSAAFVSFQIYNTAGPTVYIDDCELRKVTISAQIADGAITANKILAGAVVAGKIAANAISSNEIAAGTITAARAQIADATIVNAKIASLAVDDAKIANVSIGKLTVGSLTADLTVSARIKTANSGLRAEMNSSGFYHYDSSGNEDFGADGSGVRVRASITGSTITGGTFQTDSNTSNPRVVISGGAAGQVTFYGGSSAYNTQSNPGYLKTYYQVTGTSGTGFTTQACVQMGSGDYNNYGGAYVTVSSYTPQAGESRVDLSANSIYVNGGFYASNSIQANGALVLVSGGTSYITSAPAAGNYAPDAATGDLVIRNDTTGTIRLGTKGGGNNSALVIDGTNTRSYLQGSLSLNNQQLFVSGVGDGNHRLLYTNLVDGPYLHGNNGVLLGYVNQPANSSGSAPNGIRVGAFSSTANGRFCHTGSSGNFHIDSSVGSNYTGWFQGAGCHIGNAAQAHGVSFASAFTVSSARKLKKKIKPSPHGLVTLSKLAAVEFEFDNEGAGGRKHIGFVADDMEVHLPHAIHRWEASEAEPDADKRIGIDQATLLAVTIQAMQELSADVQALRLELATLKKGK